MTDSSASIWQSFLFLFTLFSSISSVKATSTDKIENDNEDSLKPGGSEVFIYGVDFLPDDKNTQNNTFCAFYLLKY